LVSDGKVVQVPADDVLELEELVLVVEVVVVEADALPPLPPPHEARSPEPEANRTPMTDIA